MMILDYVKPKGSRFDAVDKPRLGRPIMCQGWSACRYKKVSKIDQIKTTLKHSNQYVINTRLGQNEQGNTVVKSGKTKQKKKRKEGKKVCNKPQSSKNNYLRRVTQKPLVMKLDAKNQMKYSDSLKSNFIQEINKQGDLSLNAH